ncbi:MAG TPA: acyl-CoA dehydratase activase, partial [Syntrophales bacterium]|nr:acyl-CoA dehydratase activase [Syntrophales bacterium]
NIANVVTGNKCAAGTGEFFLQQIKRMDVSLNDAYSVTEENPYHVSSRCAVFCKSDCTHATNIGVPREQVTAGICRMMADKILQLLKRVKKDRVMLIGGTVSNRQMVRYLQEEIDHLIIPAEAICFEALGAALYASDHPTRPYTGYETLFLSEERRFDSLPTLCSSEDLVQFKTLLKEEITAGDTCILGLDVGSTTTKAVLIRSSDNAILESVYLRTNGDPVGASRKCYSELLKMIAKKIDPGTIRITGLGVCGSGRRIAGLHADTQGVINEITAHATAAIHFDPQVDTILEIGGQDAKYTFIHNGVPSDYAMNEACSAGTGSFLEESAGETLGVRMKDIAGLALQGKRPPNFNDQCAAFIGSDIKSAVQEGMSQEDILAGLVYSVCQNYLNRVKGNRPVGRKVFMQGGVCYNRAVPLAMAALLESPIIVPPEPGLMGAFGVALAVKERIGKGLLPPGDFDLASLVKREVEYHKPFICNGHSQMCDRGCEISVIGIEGKKIPFGGACDRYYNKLIPGRQSADAPDLVMARQRVIFTNPVNTSPINGRSEDRKTVGMNRSFMVHTYFPLFSTFFTEAGFKIAIPDSPDPRGIEKMEAAFCFPGELSHGFFSSLLDAPTPVDFLFLPHFKAVPDSGGEFHSQLCPIAQAEPYYLKTTFADELEAIQKRGTRIVSPVLDMTRGMHHVEDALYKTAVIMGVPKAKIKTAITKALLAQMDAFETLKYMGRQFVDDLEADPRKIGIVIFGRPYNSFAKEANKGIPAKFASRGYPVAPFDCLSFEGERGKAGLFWGIAQKIYKGAEMVKKHPRLFPVFITNFSCGPDSFLVSYFRDLMGRKPSLTLELDSHTADAGLETRIEAYLDIVSMYQHTVDTDRKQEGHPFVPARISRKADHFTFVSSAGEEIPLTNRDVKIVIPSMGKYASEAFAAVFRNLGFNAQAHPAADEDILKSGKTQTLGKECLPMILTTGMLLNTIGAKKEDEKVAFFMPTAHGPCRLGQYEIYMNDLITKLAIPDVAILPLSSGAGYAGMGGNAQKGLWSSIVVSDAIEDVRSVILANARDVDRGLEILEEEWSVIIAAMESDGFDSFKRAIASCSERLSTIPMKIPLEELPVISLVGEIFVRRDSLSRRFITERLAASGFAVSCAPVAEWVHYIDLLFKKGLLNTKMSAFEYLETKIRRQLMGHIENRIQSTFKGSGLYHGETISVDSIVAKASPFISLDLAGEGILTVGNALRSIAHCACGVISIGPFGCMQNRIAESILNKTMTREVKIAACPESPELKTMLAGLEYLPFLAIESDGMPFPQIIEAKLETFLLQARRLHHRMLESVNGADLKRCEGSGAL